jgi:2'-5' RNA ligase
VNADALLRLFVAIELTDEVREALGWLQAELRSRGLTQLRWVRPDGIHLTLKFLGETPAARVATIEKALEEAVAGEKAHELALGSLGTFGGKNPRVMWIDLAGDVEMLLGLQERVDAALVEVGFPREGRKFAPHLTLARVRPEIEREMAGRIAVAMRETAPPAAKIPVREVSLMRSILGRGGAVYERLAAFPLGATGPR